MDAKNGEKGGKPFYKLMSNVVYRKAMNNLRNRVGVRLINNQKDYLKWTSKPSFATQKIFSNNLVSIHKIKTTLIPY